jgi:hypothetical protein
MVVCLTLPLPVMVAEAIVLSLIPLGRQLRDGLGGGGQAIANPGDRSNKPIDIFRQRESNDRMANLL